MKSFVFWGLAALCLSAAAPATAQADLAQPVASYRSPAMERAIARNTYALTYDEGGVGGAGGDLLRERTRTAQFVLLGEGHHEAETPRFSLGLYRMLEQAHGFDRLVIEIDPLAVDAINAASGDLDRIVELARTYPTHIGFASDQDLRLYAAISGSSTPAAPVIWGIEQAQGAARYLEELAELASSPELRDRAAALRDEAATKDVRTSLGFMHDDATTTSRLEALRADWSPEPGSRADQLLSDLIRSTTIYGYNRRAGEGEPTGWLNNSDREALFRTNFLRLYRIDAVGGRTPRALFKMGSWHMYRGLSPANAFTVANLAHELAAMNDMRAVGVDVIALGGHVADLSALPRWMEPILPAESPAGPIVIDLEAIHARAPGYASLLPEADRARLISYIMAHDLVVILPENAKATWHLSGFPPR